MTPAPALVCYAVAPEVLWAVGLVLFVLIAPAVLLCLGWRLSRCGHLP